MVENRELVSAVAFRRNQTQILSRLRTGTYQKAVITSHGRMEAVVLSIPEYEKLTEAAK